MSPIDTSTIAKEIADDLFLFDSSEATVRLVLEFEGGRKLDGPGWCKQAVIDRIEQALKDKSEAVKPLEFPAPSESRAWGNPCNLTAEEVGLDQGWRLMMLGEVTKQEDEFFWGNSWISAREGIVIYRAQQETYRTRRPLPTPKKRVPLARNEWIAGAPWFVRLKPRQPEDETRFSVCMVTLVDCNGIYSASGGGADFWTHDDAAKELERTQDGVTFSECSKIEEAE